jgi:hypothetical protein
MSANREEVVVDEYEGTASLYAGFPYDQTRHVLKGLSIQMNQSQLDSKGTEEIALGQICIRA